MTTDTDITCRQRLWSYDLTGAVQIYYYFFNPQSLSTQFQKVKYW